MYVYSWEVKFPYRWPVWATIPRNVIFVELLYWTMVIYGVNPWVSCVVSNIITLSIWITFDICMLRVGKQKIMLQRQQRVDNAQYN